MLWEAWQTRKATGIPTSDLLRAGLIREYGADWLLVASDLDQAVYEWGHFIEGKCEKAVRREQRKVDDINASLAKSGASFHQRLTEERIEEVYDEQLAYWVHGWVKMYVGTAAEGGPDSELRAGGKVYMRKRATYDPALDGDMETDDVETIDVD